MNFLSINFLRKVDYNEFLIEDMSDECKELLKLFFSEDVNGKDEERIEIFNQVSSDA